LYGEIRNFSLPRNKTQLWDSRYWRSALCFFGTEHAKEEKKEIWKNFGISVSMWAKIQNTLQNILKM
jgi:hypothetical protein